MRNSKRLLFLWVWNNFLGVSEVKTCYAPAILITIHNRCCKSDACKGDPAPSCKAGDLVPAFMERPDQVNAYAPFLSQSDKSDSGSSNGAVIGGAVGGGVVGIIIIGVLLFLFLRRRRRNRQPTGTETGANAMTPMIKDRPEDRHSVQYSQSRKKFHTLHCQYWLTRDSTADVCVPKSQLLPINVSRERSPLPRVQERRDRTSGTTSREFIRRSAQILGTTSRVIVQWSAEILGVASRCNSSDSRT